MYVPDYGATLSGSVSSPLKPADDAATRFEGKVEKTNLPRINTDRADLGTGGGWPLRLAATEGVLWSLFSTESRCAGDERPALDGTPVAGFPVSVFGVQGKAGLDDEVHGGLVVKGDINVVEAIRGKELYVVDGLPLVSSKRWKLLPFIAPDGGFATFDDGGAQRSWKRFAFGRAFGAAVFCG